VGQKIDNLEDYFHKSSEISSTQLPHLPLLALDENLPLRKFCRLGRFVLWYTETELFN
jgi:hypothetical protein